MAATQIIVIALLALLAPTFATQYIVGDSAGWKINFDYQTWAQDKMFVVGDTLVFKYAPGFHNVFKVNGTGFAECIKPPLSEAFTTGNDVIPLKNAGNKWYICGVADHCAAKNQKLKITVYDSMAPAPAPVAPTNSATQGMVAYGLMAAAFAIILIAMV